MHRKMRKGRFTPYGFQMAELRLNSFENNCFWSNSDFVKVPKIFFSPKSKIVIASRPPPGPDLGRQLLESWQFWKLPFGNFHFGHFRFPRVEIQTQRVETKRNTLFFYVFDSKMSLLDVLPFFFLIMYDDGWWMMDDVWWWMMYDDG